MPESKPEALGMDIARSIGCRPGGDRACGRTSSPSWSAGDCCWTACACCTARFAAWRDIFGTISMQAGATALPITALVGFRSAWCWPSDGAAVCASSGPNPLLSTFLAFPLIRNRAAAAAILVAGRSELDHHGADRRDARDRGSTPCRSWASPRVTGWVPRALALAVSGPAAGGRGPFLPLAGGMVAADSMDITRPPWHFVQSLPACMKVGNLVLAMGKSIREIVWRAGCLDRLPLGA